MKINSEYDVGAAFQATENELIESMIRNMKRHKAEETKEGLQWEQWQVLQLESLEKYRKSNQEKFGKQFNDINAQIDQLIKGARIEGNMDQEISILQAIRNGWKGKKSSGKSTAEFFKVNDRKLDALIKATKQDMQKAETAILRMANDKYRKVIFNAQTYANNGAGTYEKSVDMATKDMLSSGLNCVEYKNKQGKTVARHTLADYADMAIRTASKRAYLTGEGEKRKEWGISTVIVNKRGNPCPLCLPFVGKVLIDDVWSGGQTSDGPYPHMSVAVAAGLYHPRCKDSHTTYFPGISTADDMWTKAELAAVEKANKKDQKQQHAARQVEKYQRMKNHSLDKGNQKFYHQKVKNYEFGAGESTRNTGKPVEYNDKYDYSINLDDYPEKVNTGLSKASGSVAKMGGKDGFEHMHLVDLDSGKLSYYETNNEPNTVGEKGFWDFVMNNPEKKFAFVHNHNTDSSFSEMDMRTLLTTENIPMMVAVRNDGVKYVAERSGGALKSGWFEDLYQEEIQQLYKMMRDGIISQGEVSRRKEILIVDNLLRDYTKGKGLLEIDGRKNK